MKGPCPHLLDDVSIWCGWRDSNSHALRRCLLRAVRLPIPPHPQGGRGRIPTISNRAIPAVLPDIHYPPKSVLSVLMRPAIIKTKVRNRSLAGRDPACWWPGLESNQPLRIFSPSLSPFELPGHGYCLGFRRPNSKTPAGVPEGDRTLDARIKSPVLYQLSYWHKSRVFSFNRSTPRAGTTCLPVAGAVSTLDTLKHIRGCLPPCASEVSAVASIPHGGEGGIRTHGRLPAGSFQDCCHKPLDHPTMLDIKHTAQYPV